MLLAGDHNCIPDMNNLIVYNLSSLIEGYPLLDILPSVNSVDYMDDLNFDIVYSNYIMTNDNVFYEFFCKIIYPLYNGIDIYLIIRRDFFYDNITESLFKFIQQRYGYLGAIIGEIEDLDYINPDIGFGQTGLEGIFNLDMDKERFTNIHLHTILKLSGENIDMFTNHDFPIEIEGG